MDISVLGVDLGKNVCSVVGLDAPGAVVMRRKMRRETLIALAEKLPPCVVAMEACCGSGRLGGSRRPWARRAADVLQRAGPMSKRGRRRCRGREDGETTTRPTMR